MLDNNARKELINAYKKRARTNTGGIYIIRNAQNGKILLEIASDIEAAENRFSFAKKTGGCINFKLSKDWADFGPEAFTFEIAETIDKNEDQTPTEFREELNLLKKMWAENYASSEMY